MSYQEKTPTSHNSIELQRINGIIKLNEVSKALRELNKDVPSVFSVIEELTIECTREERAALLAKIGPWVEGRDEYTSLSDYEERGSGSSHRLLVHQTESFRLTRAYIDGRWVIHKIELSPEVLEGYGKDFEKHRQSAISLLDELTLAYPDQLSGLVYGGPEQTDHKVGMSAVAFASNE